MFPLVPNMVILNAVLCLENALLYKKKSISLRSLFRVLILTALLMGSVALYALDYTVVKGDTLYSISRRYGVTVRELMQQNKLIKTSDLRTGMILKIPNQPNQNVHSKTQEPLQAERYTTHKVQKGETLYTIARRYGMPVRELLHRNDLSEDSIIRPGRVLIVQVASQTQTKNLWPITGRRQSLSGKLRGVRIWPQNGALAYAVRQGTVMWQGPYRDYGVVALIVSKDGYVYLYGGNLHFLVNTGELVKAGEPIGKVDSKIPIHRTSPVETRKDTDYNSEPILYFSVFRNGAFVNVEQAPRG